MAILVTGGAGYIESKFEPRRPGDPAQLVADPARASPLFGWRPVHSDLHEIIESAWQWHLAHPKGCEEYRVEIIAGACVRHTVGH
jgi:UDP-glucose 4-epimerase